MLNYPTRFRGLEVCVRVDSSSYLQESRITRYETSWRRGSTERTIYKEPTFDLYSERCGCMKCILSSTRAKREVASNFDRNLER